MRKSIGFAWALLMATIATLGASMFILTGVTPILERLAIVEVTLFFSGFIIALATDD